MYLPLIAIGLIDPESFEPGNDPNFMIMFPFFIFLILFVFYVMVVSFGMQAAFFRICMQKDLNIVASDDYFHFFKKRNIPKILKLSLASTVISVLAIFLCFLPFIYVIVPLMFFPIMFAFNPDLSATEIIKASFTLGNKKWLITFGLLFVSIILAYIVGFMMCLVGIYVTAYFVYLPAYHIYKDVIGFEDTNEINHIGDKPEF